MGRCDKATTRRFRHHPSQALGLGGSRGKGQQSTLEPLSIVPSHTARYNDSYSLTQERAVDVGDFLLSSSLSAGRHAEPPSLVEGQSPHPSHHTRPRTLTQPEPERKNQQTHTLPRASPPEITTHALPAVLRNAFQLHARAACTCSQPPSSDDSVRF